MSKFRELAWLVPLIAVLAAVLLPAYTLVMKLPGRKIRPLSSAWIKALSVSAFPCVALVWVSLLSSAFFSAFFCFHL